MVEFIVLEILRARNFSKGPVIVTIIGHTDYVGSSESNVELGRARAQGARDAIRDFMTKRGFPLPAIRTDTCGEDQPIAPNTTAEGRAANRRVEVCLSAGVLL